MRPDARQAPKLEGLELEYTVVREIGRGATAVVYVAQRITDGHEVAVKIMKEGWGGGNADQLALTVHESETLARLSHRNIVGYRGLYITSAGNLALVMEYVNGETLRQLLRQHPHPPYDAVDTVLRDVASALAHAHAHNVVHYDVKPENIFIDTANNRALLSDFGTATSMLAASDPELPTVVAGTPRYMSPEQINGAPPDMRSDLYSLGLVGWELIAGVPPWTGESMNEILFSQKNELLPDLRVLRPDVPGRLVLAVEGALRKDLRFRLSSAEEFLLQLDHDAPMGSSGQSRRFIRTSTLTAAPPRPPTGRGAVDAGSETVVLRRGGVNESTTEAFELEHEERDFPVTVPPRVDEFASGSPNRRWWAVGALVVGAIVLGSAMSTRATWGEKRSAPAGTASVNVARASRPRVTDSVLGVPATSTPAGETGTPGISPPEASPPIPARDGPTRAALSVAVPPSTPVTAPSRVTSSSPATETRVTPRRAASGERVDLPAPAATAAPPRGGTATTPPRAPDRALHAAEIATVEAAARTEAAATLLRTALDVYTTAATLGDGRTAARIGGLRRARDLLNSAAQVQPSVPEVYLLRARVTADLGDLRDAWGDAETATRLGKWWEGQAMTVIVDLAARDTAGASAGAAALLKRVRERREALTADEGRYLALALTAVGDIDGAIEALQLIDPANNSLAPVLRDPGLVRLRSDARFARLGASQPR